MSKTVLLTLGRMPKSLDLARGFHALGWRVVVAEPFAWHLCRASRMVSKSLRVRAPARDPDGYLDDLRKVIEREHPQGWSKLGELYFLARSDPDPEVRSLATLSEMVVLRDLVPAYRIRLPTAGTFDGTETKPNNH